MEERKKRRKYIRISTVLPVEFCVLDQKERGITPWLQGFTSDIGKGGICITINDLWWGFWDRFNLRGAQIALRVNLPFKDRSIPIRAKVASLPNSTAG